MICKLCHGAGTLMCMVNKVLEFWTCPACGGGGSRVQSAPAYIGPGTRQR